MKYDNDKQVSYAGHVSDSFGNVHLYMSDNLTKSESSTMNHFPAET